MNKSLNGIFIFLILILFTGCNTDLGKGYNEYITGAPFSGGEININTPKGLIRKVISYQNNDNYLLVFRKNSKAYGCKNRIYEGYEKKLQFLIIDKNKNLFYETSDIEKFNKKMIELKVDKKLNIDKKKLYKEHNKRFFIDGVKELEYIKENQLDKKCEPVDTIEYIKM